MWSHLIYTDWEYCAGVYVADYQTRRWYLVISSQINTGVWSLLYLDLRKTICGWIIVVISNLWGMLNSHVEWLLKSFFFQYIICTLTLLVVILMTSFTSTWVALLLLEYSFGFSTHLCKANILKCRYCMNMKSLLVLLWDLHSYVIYIYI